MEKLEILRRFWGYSTFRAGQEELIDGILAGRDVFGIMPTGGGKSMCYQIPALMLSGMTLVISPLISLMRDQVMALKSMGVPAAYINSTLSASQLRQVYRNMRQGAYKIVYVAPERLDYGGFGEAAMSLPIDFVAVDEAHCISQWGQDFRPSYLRIVQFIRTLPNRPVVGAFTATATVPVRVDVERILELHDPVRIVTGFDRPNLYFEVQHPQRKEEALLSLLASRREKSGIVYCATRKKVESVCETLQAHGYAATRYHAGLDEEERRVNQEEFLYDIRTVMVATNAFGMGIDKSNVSYVIHYNMPKSMEAYYQEAGRAGRDGAEAECVLLYGAADISMAKFFIQNQAENEELSETQREQVRRQDLVRLDAMVSYCKTSDCLRGYILEYFGQMHGLACGRCGNCKGEFETVDITREAQMILSCVKRIHDHLGYAVGAMMVANVLHGSRQERLTSLGLDCLTTYGLLKHVPSATVRTMLDELESQGYLQTESQHGTVCLTVSAGEVLYRGKTVTVKRRKAENCPKPTASDGALSSEEALLYDRLRNLRASLAAKASVPAYVVFSNATLTDMVKKHPKTTGEFLLVSGVGEQKAARYAEAFLGEIERFDEER